MYSYKVIEVINVIDGDTVDTRIDPRGVEATIFAREWLYSRKGDLVLRTYKGSNETVGVGDGAFGRWLGSFYDSQGAVLEDALREAGHEKT